MIASLYLCVGLCWIPLTSGIPTLNKDTDKIPPRPPLSHTPLSLTTYNPLNEKGECVPFGGQADSDPCHTANMTDVTAELYWKSGACINEWVNFPPHTVTLEFITQGKEISMECNDAFGDEAYQKQMYHPVLEMWVIPVDIMSPGYFLVVIHQYEIIRR